MHGIFGNDTDWVSGTRIQRWAEARDLAVVMPSGDNSFYLDQPVTHNLYGQFIGRELVEITRRMFPLSHRREDTFLGGLSMGGYGALRNGLRYADTFGAIAALSSADVPAAAAIYTEDNPLFFRGAATWRLCSAPWTGWRAATGTCVTWPTNWPASRPPASTWPAGLQDTLLPLNRALARDLTDRGLDVTYREAPGDHEWDFWDSQIRCVLDWLPLDDATDGVNSGNVGL